MVTLVDLHKSESSADSESSAGEQPPYSFSNIPDFPEDREGVTEAAGDWFALTNLELHYK